MIHTNSQVIIRANSSQSRLFSWNWKGLSHPPVDLKCLSEEGKGAGTPVLLGESKDSCTNEHAPANRAACGQQRSEAG